LGRTESNVDHSDNESNEDVRFEEIDEDFVSVTINEEESNNR